MVQYTGWYKIEGSHVLHFLVTEHSRVLCKTKKLESILLSRFYKEPIKKKKCMRCEKAYETYKVTNEMPTPASESRNGNGTIMRLKFRKPRKPIEVVGSWKKTKCPSCKTDVMFWDSGNNLEAHSCTVCGEHVQIMGALTC